MSFFDEWVRRIVRQEIAWSHEQPDPYPLTYSVLTIHFAEGSDMGALSIPYKPWENRTDISVPYRVVKADSNV